jgi:transcriptional regulator with GAF, ATPase, and Fis domain
MAHETLRKRLAGGTDGRDALTQDELAALLRISQALSKHRDREELFAAIAASIEGLLPADRIVVLVPGVHSDAVRVYAVHGAVKLFEGQQVPEGSVPAWVIRHCQAMLVSSPEQVRDSFPATYQKLIGEGMSGALVLPLMVQGRCIGALSIMARDAGVVDRYPRRLVDEFASLVAIALDGCIAYEQIQRLGQERQALLEVNTAIGRHLERDELFGALAVCLRDLVPTQRFGIEMPIEGDRLQGHLLTPRGTQAEPTRPSVLPAAGTACDWVLQNRQWLVVSSRDELRERFSVTFSVMSSENMESLCAMPLISGEHCRAVLFFMAERRGAYDGLRRDFLEQVAGAVAVALDDCLAHEEVRFAARSPRGRERVPAGADPQEHNFGRSSAAARCCARCCRRSRRRPRPTRRYSSSARPVPGRS